MSTSSRLEYLRISLPVPNEILHEILSDLIVQNLHVRLLQEKPDSMAWIALVVLPHVSRLFRATSIRIYAMVFSLRLGKCGDWLLQRVHGKLRHFKVPRVPPSHLRSVPAEVTRHLNELEDIIAGVDEKPEAGVLCVYGSVVRSTFLCHEALRIGFETLDLVPGRLTDVTERLIAFVRDVDFWLISLRPTKLALLVSELAVTNCAINYLSFIFWVHSNLMSKVLSSQLDNYNFTRLMTVCLKTFESLEPSVHCMFRAHQIPPERKILTRAILKDSGVVPMLEKLRSNQDDSAQDLKIRAGKLLKAWRPLLEDGTSDEEYEGSDQNAVEKDI